MTKEKYYKNMHEWRVRLRCAGMLADSENEKIKNRIEKWGTVNKVPTVSEYLKTLKTYNEAVKKQKA